MSQKCPAKGQAMPAEKPKEQTPQLVGGTESVPLWGGPHEGREVWTWLGGLEENCESPSGSQEGRPTASSRLLCCSWPGPCVPMKNLGFGIRSSIDSFLLDLTIGVRAGKGISVLFEELIDFHLQLIQTRPPSAKGQGGHILVLSFSGAQWNRIFSYLNDFPGLILSLRHMFLVNQLLLRDTKGDCRNVWHVFS